MQYRNLTALAFCAAATGGALSADPSWNGAYGGLSLNGISSTATIKGTSAHSRHTRSATLGAFAGFNKSSQGGFTWGGEVAVSTLDTTPALSGGGFGTTEFNGGIVVAPRLRAGIATPDLFFYGLLGAAISNATIRPAGSQSRDYAIGVTYGLGAEMKLSETWSVRMDLTRTDLGVSRQTFNATPRGTAVKSTALSLGLAYKF